MQGIAKECAGASPAGLAVIRTHTCAERKGAELPKASAVREGMVTPGSLRFHLCSVELASTTRPEFPASSFNRSYNADPKDLSFALSV